ncbi:phytase [Duganella sp. sic0402]|uniref:phytase n=1 Tax=Duganella sp. sic0402 TaxID=2854786 RepID=UPI001E2EC973|nr:phytase [Duganella sp. sic0402]
MMKSFITTVVLAALATSGQPVQAATMLPGLTAQAHELSALPGGGWLSIDKTALRLLDANGKERAHIMVRAKHLDTRPQGKNVLAVIVDANKEQAVPVLVDVQAGTLTAQAPFPAPAFGIESACLYRDAQQLDHLYLLAKDGQAEQWVMQGDKRLQVRKLALPPHSKHCRADDSAHQLLVSEESAGLWAYNADAEGVPSREAVLLKRPYGTLEKGAGALTVVPGGVALLDAKGKQLHLLRRDGGKWSNVSATDTGFKGAEQLASTLGADGKLQLLMGGEDAGGWQVRTPAWTGAAVPASDGKAIVMARTQTEPVARQGDAADDPAIWRNPADPSGARILGTNKKQGLLVYDLQGKELQLLEVGRLNNVDVRQDVTVGGRKLDLAVATQRDENSVMLFAIDAQGKVTTAGSFLTGLKNIYGMCLYRPADGGLEAFINDKDGTFLQYRVEASGNAISGKLLRRFKVDTQPEGCVVDDRNHRLFLGEERRGVWTVSAKGDAPAKLSMIMPVGPQLVADVEGMGIYHGDKADYLVVSSQGDNSYLVMDAKPPYKVRGSFRVGYNLVAGIDGTSETDGLEVSSANFGGPYSKGMLVIQDGYKRLPDGAQNFKYVSWDDVARALNLD